LRRHEAVSEPASTWLPEHDAQGDDVQEHQRQNQGHLRVRGEAARPPSPEHLRVSAHRLRLEEAVYGRAVDDDPARAIPCASGTGDPALLDQTVNLELLRYT